MPALRTAGMVCLEHSPMRGAFRDGGFGPAFPVALRIESDIPVGRVGVSNLEVRSIDEFAQR